MSLQICWIILKFSSFGGSDTHLSLFLKSPGNMILVFVFSITEFELNF